MPKKVQTIDGLQHSAEVEQMLNRTFYAAFDTDNAAKAIAYLKNITIHRIQQAGTPGDVLQHLEGQRYIVGVIEQRMRAGKALLHGPDPKDFPTPIMPENVERG